MFAQSLKPQHILDLLIFFFLKFIDFKERGKGDGREKEKHRFIVPLICAFICWCLYVPGQGSNRQLGRIGIMLTWPGPSLIIFFPSPLDLKFVNLLYQLSSKSITSSLSPLP